MMSKITVKESKRKLIFSNASVQISIDLDAGTWAGKNRMTKSVVFQRASFRLDKDGVNRWSMAKFNYKWSKSNVKSRFGNGTKVTITGVPEEGYAPSTILTLTLFADQSFLEIGWGAINRLDHPVRVCDFEVLYAGELLPGISPESPQVLRSGAGAEPNFVERGSDISALNGALLTYKDNGIRRSLVAGGLRYAEFARRVDLYKPSEKSSVVARREHINAARLLDLAVWDPQGKLIEHGEVYRSEDTFYLDIVTDDPFEALENYGKALRIANAAAPNVYDFPTLCGWMVSTNHLGEGKPINNSPGLVEQTRIAKDRGLMRYTPLAVRLEPDTYCYGNYGDTQQGWWDDEHWQLYSPGNGHRKGDKEGSLRKPYETFAKFCKAVADLGGIPFTYFQSSMPSNDFAVAHPGWMLNGDISRLHVPHPHHRPWTRYDYTNKGFRAHCLRVWRRLKKAGLKGVKFDYPESAWALGGGFSDKGYTTTSAYAEMFRLCREGLGSAAYIHERNLGGQTHENAPRLDATAGIVDLQRVWGDASHFEPEMASRMGVRWYKSRSVFIYYPDGKSFFENGRALPAYKRRAFLTLIAFLSGRIETGTSIGSMTDEMFYDLTRVYPVIKGIASPRPVDLLTGGKHPSVYVYKVTDEWCQVLLLNNNKRGKKKVSAPMAGNQAETGSLGLRAAASYHAFDFWNQKYLGKIKGNASLSCELRAGEVAMISVRKAEKVPQVISTNRHIMQGMMECHDVVWSGRSRSLSGSVDVVGGEQFVLTVACTGRKPRRCDGAELNVGSKGIVDLRFDSAKNRRMTFKLQF